MAANKDHKRDFVAVDNNCKWEILGAAIKDHKDPLQVNTVVANKHLHQENMAVLQDVRTHA